MANKLKFGKLRANPDAELTTHQFAQCACEDTTPCQDTITVGSADIGKVMTTFTYQGVSHSVPAASQVAFTDYQGIRAALLAVIGLYEIDPYIKVEASGSDVLITHIGEGLLTVVAFSGGTDTATRVCDYSQMCTYTGEFDAGGEDAADFTLTVNGVDHVISEADASAADTEVEAVLTAAGIYFSSVTVVLNTGVYTLTIVSDVTEYHLDGEYLPGTSCDQVFHA